MGLIELITLVGEENITCQYLTDSVLKVEDVIRMEDSLSYTEGTFATNEINVESVSKENPKIGVIVWFDYDKWPIKD